MRQSTNYIDGFYKRLITEQIYMIQKFADWKNE